MNMVKKASIILNTSNIIFNFLIMGTYSIKLIPRVIIDNTLFVLIFRFIYIGIKKNIFPENYYNSILFDLNKTLKTYKKGLDAAKKLNDKTSIKQIENAIKRLEKIKNDLENKGY